MIEFEVRPWATNTEGGRRGRQHLLRLGGLPGRQGLQQLRVLPRPEGRARPEAARTATRWPSTSPTSSRPSAAATPSILHGPVETAHTSSALAHLGNIAYRLGRQLKFDPTAETFVGDSEADAMLTRHYRTPFVVPETV